MTSWWSTTGRPPTTPSSASGGDKTARGLLQLQPALRGYLCGGAARNAPHGRSDQPGTCFRQVEFVGILKGTANRVLAEQWVDFMLSPTFQEDMPLKMAVFPVNVQAVLDEEFAEYVAIPDQPVIISPDEIAANRETWIQQWTETILR